MTLERDYDLEEISQAIGMSTRWIREQVKAGAECIRYGRKIKMTAAQVERLRAAHTVAPVEQSITTGRKRKSA